MVAAVRVFCLGLFVAVQLSLRRLFSIGFGFLNRFKVFYREGRRGLSWLKKLRKVSKWKGVVRNDNNSGESGLSCTVMHCSVMIDG